MAKAFRPGQLRLDRSLDRTRAADAVAGGRATPPMGVVAHYLMPNHFHLALWPFGDDDLSTWMQWLLTAHPRRHHRHYHSSGHVWQGRFKAFPIQEDAHLSSVLRSIERNPSRAGSVAHAQDWEWSRLRSSLGRESGSVLDPTPMPRNPDRLERVSAPLSQRI